MFFVVVTGLFSCKDKDLPPVVNPTTPLTVVNATGDTINYYLNGTRQNNLSNLFPGGSTGYLNISTGTQNYQFKKAGSANVLFSAPFTLDTANYYSMFVGGESADKAFLTVDSLTDAATILSADTTFTIAMLRFVNASPDAGAVDVTFSKSDTLQATITNKNFKYAGPFSRLKIAANHVRVYLTGTATPKIDTTLTFLQGNIYTLFTKGSVNAKGTSAFSISLITNH